MKVKDITRKLEEWAPLSYQENYDNSGLIVGNQSDEVTNVLITLDVTEDVIDEAIQNDCNLIISHHPLIFTGLKQITDNHWVERCVKKAIKNDLAVYAIHTNLDNVISGVNRKIAEKLDLKELEILSPKEQTLYKLVTYVPIDSIEGVLEALYKAGAGEVGEYDKCSFQSEGKGTFRPLEKAHPTIGQIGTEETVNETRIEVLLPVHLKDTIVDSLKISHPYEEVAFYLTSLDNKNQEVGSGVIGNLSQPMEAIDFLTYLKKQMNLEVIRHTKLPLDKIQRVALCGGSGSFLLNKARNKKADVFISADFKYHEFFEANDEVLIADIGHYESEAYTKELIYDYLSQKFANIAFRLSGVVTNPIIYT